ncbi:MAG TPA: pilus assembly protein CpaE [Actinomycetes bacterium]
MVTVELARRLRDAGLQWQPQRGDAFVIPDRDMDDEVFVLSDLTIDVHELPQGVVLGFNGTVEWALDSVEQRHALWLPSETQLRNELGDHLVALLREADGWRVGLADGSTFDGSTAEEAYGFAVLDRLGRGHPS